jgi:malate permease and related proteins
MLNAASSIFSILIIIFIGFILSKKGSFDQKIASIFSKIVINISLPSLMIINVMQRFDKQTLLQYKIGLLVAFSCVSLSYFLSWIIGKAIKLSTSKLGIFCAMFTFSNTIFIGLPVNIALFGEESILFVLLYYLANSFLFWTIGVYNIKKSNSKSISNKFNIDTFKKIFSPPLIGFLAGVLFVMINISLPVFINDTLKYLGALTTPLSMIFIGITISSIDMHKFKPSLDGLIVILGRFLITPIIVFSFVNFFNFSYMLKNVFVLESAMPIIAQVAIVSKAYDNESDYASILVSLTTILSLLFIPIYSFIL